jgi:hypothetical protein
VLVWREAADAGGGARGSPYRVQTVRAVRAPETVSVGKRDSSRPTAIVSSGTPADSGMLAVVEWDFDEAGEARPREIQYPLTGARASSPGQGWRLWGTGRWRSWPLGPAEDQHSNAAAQSAEPAAEEG